MARQRRAPKTSKEAAPSVNPKNKSKQLNRSVPKPLSVASKRRFEKLKLTLDGKVSELCQRQQQLAQEQHKQFASSISVPLSKDSQYELLKTRITMLSLETSVLHAKLESHVNLWNLQSEVWKTKAGELIDKGVSHEFQQLKEMANTYLSKMGETGIRKLRQIELINEKLLGLVVASDVATPEEVLQV